ELIEWSDTSILVDGIVRSVAAVLDPTVGYDALKLAERLFQHAALEACAASQGGAPSDDVIRDAERYRWLHGHANPGYAQSGRPWSVQCSGVEIRDWAHIDELIDAAIREQRGEKNDD